MFAIIETGSNQYKVWEGGEFDVEKLEGESGKKVVFAKVLLVSKDDQATIVDRDTLAATNVEAEIIKQFRDDKILVFKMKRRKNTRRYHGHRQDLTRVKITKINC